MPTKNEIVTVGKYYLYLIMLGSFVFLMVKPPRPVTMGMDTNLVEAGKLSIQSVIVNPTIKQIFMFCLLLYTVFVVIESLILIRDCAVRIYYKNKENKVTE